MDIATEETVLGDFDNAVYTDPYNQVTSRFFRDAKKFMVETEGPGGKLETFEITHTFGWYPLQQYLVPFDGGRLQCLPIAWDVKEKKWYRVPPVEKIAPDDWLYWTNNGQNWNGMCAECHSTNLQKNFDPETGTFDTTWSEIDVSCEACHGPGSLYMDPEIMNDQDRDPDSRKEAHDAGAEVILPADHRFRMIRLGGEVLQEWPIFRPVVDADNSLVGMVTSTDLIRYLTEQY